MNLMILLGIIVVAIILVITAFVVITKKPKKKTVKKVEEREDFDFEDLMAIVKNSETSSEKLLDTIQKFNDNFSIDDKNEQKYMVFLSRCLTHKNVTKDVFQYFHKELKAKNTHYKKDLEVIEKKALG